MSPAYDRVKALFVGAQQLPSAEREAFLRGRCGDDQALFDEVNSLLEHAIEDSLIDGELAVLPEPFVDDPPERIGPYRVLRELGRGGMAVVFEAEQDNPRRRVALKVLLVDRASPDTLRRFDLEGLALARLEHPGIAKIFEASEWFDGSSTWPYIAMEYIDGPPIDEYADQADLDVPARLELMADVCDAVQHAHQRGIIHRDLKPANILVGPTGADARPRVLDFGIARLSGAGVADPLQTRAGQVLGTLQYMSPEQLEGAGAVDTRTDVYTLGLLLYQLLAGQPAYDLRGLSLFEMVDRISRNDPTPLGTLRRELRGDISRIVAKALERDKEQRYASAAELAADLRRYLRHEPVLATPPTWRYQLSKLARRRRGLVLGLASTLLTIVVGATAATVGFVEARRERDAKEQARQKEAEARQAAETVTDFLQSIIAAGRPDRAGRSATIKEVLDRSAADIDVRFAEQPRVQAILHATLARTYVELGAYAAAAPHATAALEGSSALFGPRADQTLAARELLAEVHYFSGDRVASLAEFQALLQGRLSAPDTDASKVIEALAGVALVQTRLHRYEEALETFAQIERYLERIEEPDPQMVSDLMTNKGSLYTAMGRGSDAEALYRQLADRARQTDGPDHPRTLLAEANLAATMLVQSRWGDARDMLAEVLPRQSKVLGPNHSKTLITLLNLAAAERELGESQVARARYRDGLARAEATYGALSPSARLFELGLVRQLVAEGDWAVADPVVTAAHPRYLQSLGASHPGTRTLEAALLHVRAAQGRRAEVRILADSLIAALDAEIEAGATLSGRWLAAAADALVAAGRRDAARARLAASVDRAGPPERDAARAKLVELDASVSHPAAP